MTRDAANDITDFALSMIRSASKLIDAAGDLNEKEAVDQVIRLRNYADCVSKLVPFDEAAWKKASAATK